VKRRSGQKSSLDKGGVRPHFRDDDDDDDALLDGVGREAPLHRAVVSNLLELSPVSYPIPKCGRCGCYPFRSGSLSEPDPYRHPRFSRLSLLAQQV
jgi:hypothetical protein